jgi:hypothetical protein
MPGEDVTDVRWEAEGARIWTVKGDADTADDASGTLIVHVVDARLAEYLVTLHNQHLEARLMHGR